MKEKKCFGVVSARAEREGETSNISHNCQQTNVAK